MNLTRNQTTTRDQADVLRGGTAVSRASRRFVVIETTEGAEAFGCCYAGTKLPYGFRIATEQTFATKEAAQEWVWSEMEAWGAL